MIRPLAFAPGSFAASMKGIRCATAYHNKQRLMPSNALVGTVEGFLDTICGSPHHFGIYAEFLAVFDPEIVLRAIGVENRGDVIFRVARCKQHSGHGEHPLHALGLQHIKAVADDGGGKFEVAIFHRVLRQALLEVLGEHGEFGDRIGIPAAMATQHYAQFCHFACLP